MTESSHPPDHPPLTDQPTGRSTDFKNKVNVVGNKGEEGREMTEKNTMAITYVASYHKYTRPQCRLLKALVQIDVTTLADSLMSSNCGGDAATLTRALRYTHNHLLPSSQLTFPWLNQATRKR